MLQYEWQSGRVFWRFTMHKFVGDWDQWSVTLFTEKIVKIKFVGKL